VPRTELYLDLFAIKLPKTPARLIKDLGEMRSPGVTGIRHIMEALLSATHQKAPIAPFGHLSRMRQVYGIGHTPERQKTQPNAGRCHAWCVTNMSILRNYVYYLANLS